MAPAPGSLGRITPPDFEHVQKYRFTIDQPVAEVEKTMHVYKTWRVFYDQGRQGACVGYSSSQMMTILNRRRYDAKWLWQQARLHDIWDDNDDLSDPDQGTSVRAAMDILRKVGHEIVRGSKTYEPRLTEGITENRWATSVDEIRTSIARGIPVTVGVNWYEAFDYPIQKGREWWVDIDGWSNSNLRGGHAFTLNAASDKRQAFRTPNNWGNDWPQVWFPYEVVETLLAEDGEATLVTDRI